MKVGIYTYARAGLGTGGLQLQIRETAAALEQLGIQVRLINPWKPDLETLDVLHIFSFDSSSAAYGKRARVLGLRVVASPVLNGFERGHLAFIAKARLAQSVPGLWTEFRYIQGTLANAHVVVALNSAEADLIRHCFRSVAEQIQIVPNGVRRLAVPASTGPPGTIRRPFALMVGSVQPRKNQLQVIRAFRDADLDLVIVGSPPDGHVGYLEQCLAAADERCHFLGPLDPDDPILGALYVSARALVLFSTSEVMPLVLGEAISSNLPVIVSDRVPVDPALRTAVRVVKLRRPELLVEAVADTSWATIPSTPQPTWLDVAEQLAHLYRGIVLE